MHKFRLLFFRSRIDSIDFRQYFYHFQFPPVCKHIIDLTIAYGRRSCNHKKSLVCKRIKKRFCVLGISQANKHRMKQKEWMDMTKKSNARPTGMVKAVGLGLCASLAITAILIFICAKLIEGERIGEGDRKSVV